jgi:hypothetical protein
MVVHVLNPRYLEGRGKRVMSVRTVQEEVGRPYLKN